MLRLPSGSLLSLGVCALANSVGAQSPPKRTLVPAAYKGDTFIANIDRTSAGKDGKAFISKLVPVTAVNRVESCRTP